MILQYTNLIIRPKAERDLVILHFEMSPTLEHLIFVSVFLFLCYD